MTEMGDAFREHRNYVRRRKDRNRNSALATFDKAIELAIRGHMELVELVPSVHYRLIVYHGSGKDDFWIYNLYPGNQRIYSDPNYKGPFLKVPHPWNFIQIIKAVNRLERKEQ